LTRIAALSFSGSRNNASPSTKKRPLLLISTSTHPTHQLRLNSHRRRLLLHHQSSPQSSSSRHHHP
jgi:hypothetical protein